VAVLVFQQHLIQLFVKEFLAEGASPKNTTDSLHGGVGLERASSGLTHSYHHLLLHYNRLDDYGCSISSYYQRRLKCIVEDWD